MLLRSRTGRVVGLGAVCLAGVFAFTREPEEPPAEAPRAPSARVQAAERAAAPSVARKTSVASPVEEAPSARDSEQAALKRRLEASTLVMTVPPTNPPAPRVSRGGGPPPPPSPELRARRQVALETWKQAAQALLTSCVPRPSQARQHLALEVSFAPLRDEHGDSLPTFMPEWIAVPPQELERLWKDTPPDTLQDCLSRARGLTLEIPRTDDARPGELPAFTESVHIQL